MMLLLSHETTPHVVVIIRESEETHSNNITSVVLCLESIPCSMPTNNAARFIHKISARVFCQWKGTGGNPVTVFMGENLVGSELAKTCAWESVVIDPLQKRMAFYMPTGEEVSFCAHAAMGGAFCMAEQTSMIRFQDSSETTYQAQIDVPDQIVSLHMQAQLQQQKVTNSPLLFRLIRDTLGLQSTDVQSSSFCHASIARPKTLIRVHSVEALHQAKAPLNPEHFKSCCDALDHSTGLYLYAKVNDEEYECRQFPRASGYPEDPATGIAAAALAASLDVVTPRRRYKFHQGTAMGKASLIMVDDMEWTEATNEGKDRLVSFNLVGHVQIDERETIDAL